VADPTAAVRLAEEAVTKQPTWANLNTLGAILYRAGRFDKSMARLKEAIQKTPDKRGSWADWLFLAMAHHRLGQAKEAKECLAKAHQLLGAAKAARWTDRLEMDILRREAEALVKKAKP
jgi:tetratricopeptide (TPR) repeat protein